MADDPRKPQSQVPLSDLTLENMRAGKVEASDLTIRRETLLEQAALAERQGYPELARNFRRAAELTAVPNDGLLELSRLYSLSGRHTAAGFTVRFEHQNRENSVS